jgi:2-(3-amino-3-carboxypropyl)histidine synthase
VFVDIKVDVQHFVDTLVHNFHHVNPDLAIALVGTIQFSTSLHAARAKLLSYFPNVFIPQVRPLSPGMS